MSTAAIVITPMVVEKPVDDDIESIGVNGTCTSQHCVIGRLVSSLRAGCLASSVT